MTAARAFGSLALADFRERVRRRSFLAALAATAFLGLQAIEGRISVALGGFQGAPSSAWSGSVMTMVATTFLALIGFYVVKNAVERDRRSGVGQILAATTVSRWTYTLAKAASHWLVLGAMVAVLALAAAAMQLSSGNGLEVGKLLAPLVLVALPAMAVVAALAILFETIPGLRGGFGNVAWFFVWGGIFALSMVTRGFDLFGIQRFQREMGAAVARLDPSWNGAFAIGAGSEMHAIRQFEWTGLTLDRGFFAERFACLGVALVLALLAGLPFDRFDGTRGRQRKRERRRESERRPSAPAARSGGASEGDAAPAGRVPMLLGRLAPAERDFGLARLAFAEGWVQLRAMPWWWWVAGLGIALAGWFLDPASSRGTVLVAAFLWPALVWSGLGCRDRASAVEPLLAAAPRALGRQLPATWLAGTAVGMILVSGVVVRLAVTGDYAGALGVVCGCGFVAALALACGIASGGARLFEGIYVALWYVGPLNRTPALDFAAASEAAASSAIPLRMLVAAAGLVAVAVFFRRRWGGEHGARFA
ncbi:MAG: hypothetical protein ABI639_14640 [Thermoanaerobaculia bacterium]